MSWRNGWALREMARKHCISRSLIRQWIHKYETGQLTDELDEVRIAEYGLNLAKSEISAR
jgi:transposase-like protein